jgi:hypothetical protein
VSADNWAVCPECLKQAYAEHEELQGQVVDSYGKIPIEEFDALRAKVAEGVDVESLKTFREDYEIYGAETGIIKVRYSGTCQACKCGVDFEFEKPVKGPFR